MILPKEGVEVKVSHLMHLIESHIKSLSANLAVDTLPIHVQSIPSCTYNLMWSARLVFAHWLFV